MKILLLLVLALPALAYLGACTSPLDLNTPRIDSVVAPAMKLRTMWTTVMSGNGNFDSVAITNWVYKVDTLYFRATRDGTPPVFSMFARLVRDTTADTLSKTIVLDGIRLRLNNVRGDSVVQLRGNLFLSPNGPSTFFMNIHIGDSAYVVNGNTPGATGLATFNYILEPTIQIEGTITFTVQISATHRVTVITRLTCEQ
jgi:hypothetical protein